MACKQKDLEKFSAAAKDEIGESGVDIQEAVETVKGLLEENYPGLRFPPEINSFVERCLRCRKFDSERAATQVHLFFKFLFDVYAIHRVMHFQPGLQQEYFYESLGVAVLKHRDSKGRMVLLTRMEKMPIATYDVDKANAAIVMTLDEMTSCSVDTQRLGIVVVCDLKGYEFGHAQQFSLSRIRAVTRIMQGSIPVRFKGFHVIRSPAIFTYTFALMKPFLREKIKNRVHVHGYDLVQLYKEVSPEILPEFLGGKQPDNDYSDVEFKNRLVAKDNYYKALFKHGYFPKEEEDNDKI